jgi:hypothetical protein
MGFIQHMVVFSIHRVHVGSMLLVIQTKEIIVINSKHNDSLLWMEVEPTQTYHT